MQNIGFNQARSTAVDYHLDEISVYANAVKLLQSQGIASPDSLCIDFGCGYGVVAESVEKLGYTYVGFDWNIESVTKIRNRGFEAHVLDLTDSDAALDAVHEQLQDRKVGLVLLIDLIEHLPDGGESLLTGIRNSFLNSKDALLVIAVPNVAHRDIAARLSMGMFSYTKSGLLDHTHLQLFSSDSLSRMCKKIGLFQIEKNDFLLSTSDQSFPTNHPFISPHSSYSEYVASKRIHRDQHSIVNEFVRLYKSSEPDVSESQIQLNRFELTDKMRPFLSVVTRTQGARLHSLEDMLLSLAAQSSQDFELIIVFHKVDEARTKEVKNLIRKFPQEFQNRVKTLNCEHGGRAAPLNIGVNAASSEYIAFLDDDDIVFGHWVEMFAKQALKTPGRLLRSICAEQNIKVIDIDDDKRTTCVVSGPITAPYDSNYSILRHLIQNRTPFMSMAFPASLFSDLHLSFDEDLCTAEDWDFQMRVVDFCGVAQINEITAIYRRWQNYASSQTVENKSKWEADYKRILKKRDMHYFMLPPGSLDSIQTGLLVSQDTPSIKFLVKQLVKTIAIRTLKIIPLARIVRLLQKLPTPLYLQLRAIYRAAKVYWRK